jgi:4-amino-4-deoxy-L-arabinose transferase-like glycosyltransferase
MPHDDASSPIEQPSRKRRALEIGVVAAASLAVSVPLCNKAFHIDDPLYLAIARQILVDPLRPFDAPILWERVTEPAWNVSISPPGYSYWLAAWMSLGVTGEVGLHLAASVWTVLLGLATYGWACRLGPWRVAATLLVVTGPIVAAGQNLMLDVPMVALATSAIVVYLRAGDRNSLPWALAAGLLAGLSVNVKYAGVVVVGVMGLDAILWRRWRLLAAAATGLVLLAAGQFASELAYGEWQLVRARDWITRLFPSDWADVLHRTSTSVMYLGAGGGWLLLLGGGLVRRSWPALLLALAAAAGAAAALWDFRLVQPEPLSRRVLVAMLHAAVFAFSGWLVLAWVVTQLAQAVRSRGVLDWIGTAWKGNGSDRLRHGVMLAAWTGGFWFVGVLNAPFVAPRAILPCLLGVVLGMQALSVRTRGPGPAARWSAVALTAVMGLAVALADYRWAEVYRAWAPRIAQKHRPRDGTLYFVGHWGWQHYAEAAGMVAFDGSRMQLRPGDVVISPFTVHRQPLPPHMLPYLKKISVEAAFAPLWMPRTRDTDAYIAMHGDIGFGRIPWGWTAETDLLEVFRIYRFDVPTTSQAERDRP